jgi:superfamily I DNA/RNA helicase
MPWFVSREKLDPDQILFVEQTTHQKMFITGFAGTGKSVVMIHKLIEIYRGNPNAKCCIISFTHALLEMFKLGIDECGKLENRVSNKLNECNARNGQIDLVTKYTFKNNLNSPNPIRYDFIFVDEVQDLCKSDIENIKLSRTLNVYFGGDSNQSIYTEDPKDKEPTIGENTLHELLQLEQKKLVTLYRITPSILKVVKLTIPELKNKLQGTRFGHRRDADVILANASDEFDEVKYVFENAKTYAEDIELTAILFPLHTWIKAFITHVLKLNEVDITEEISKMIRRKAYTDLNQIFMDNNIRMEYVGNEHGSFRNARNKHNIVIMTYHSAKGMDFDNVFVPFLSSSRHEKFSFFLPKPLMVAFTRANVNLTISYSGESMACVDNFRDACTEVDIDSANDTDYFDF